MPLAPFEQFALPELTMTACARCPLAVRCSLQTSTGAAGVRLVVNVAAATQGRSAIKNARSGLSPSLLMPHAVAPARNPCGAVTLPVITRAASAIAIPPRKYRISAPFMSDTILLAPLSYHIVQSDDEKQFQENSLVQFHRISEVRVLFLANRMYFQS